MELGQVAADQGRVGGQDAQRVDVGVDLAVDRLHDGAGSAGDEGFDDPLLRLVVALQQDGGKDEGGDERHQREHEQVDGDGARYAPGAQPAPGLGGA